MRQSDLPNFRFIRGQGDLDGACLLYSLFNAHQALTGTRLTHAAWSSALRELKSIDSFMDNSSGSIETDDNAESERHLAETFINALSAKETFKVRTLTKMKNGMLKNRPDDSTVIVCSNAEHWFCIAEADETNAYVACSWVWQRNLHTYAEKISPELDRVFNEIVLLKDLEFFKNRALEISLTQHL